MGRHGEAKGNRIWFYVTIAYFGFSLVPIPAIPEILFKLAPIGLLIRVVFWPREKADKVCQTNLARWLYAEALDEAAITASCCLIGTVIVLTVAEKLLLRLR